jgi:hypothetical protein
MSGCSDAIMLGKHPPMLWWGGIMPEAPGTDGDGAFCGMRPGCDMAGGI